MKYQESETIELKREYTEDIRKELIAFANSFGGTLLIGIDDFGEIYGVCDPNKVIQQITNTIRDSVKPDLSLMVRYDIESTEGKDLVKITIQKGTSRPYYLSAKGLTPSGVYIRQGTSTVPATDEAIRKMIKETDGDCYENNRSLEQQLTFSYAEQIFTRKGVAFGEIQKKSLGMIADDDQYTNLGLLLSDQCPHIIKAATFSDDNQTAFHDRKEFSGSLFRQLDDAYAYLEMRNNLSARFERLSRIDSWDYPPQALREALLNAIIHREYGFAAPTLISVFPGKVEITSYGGLVPSVSYEDILVGFSACRNRKLANIFYRLEFIEAYGTGIQRIQAAYQNCASQPEFKVTANVFKTILPNMEKATKQMRCEETVIPYGTGFCASSEDEVLCGYLKKHPEITRKDIEILFQVSSATAVRMLKTFTQKGILLCLGKGKNTRYVKNQQP